MNKIKLIMPTSESPGSNGINDGGIETYKNVPMLSLTKEELQNSTDGGKNNSQPVVVEFNDFYLSIDQIPSHKELLSVCENERDYWDKFLKNDKKAVEFFDNAIKLLKKDKIRCLRISDSNTTGLLGVGEDSSPWQNLVINRYVSDKSGSQGGSYGIGASSAYACSELRTIFYNTINEQGQKAFQGRVILPSYKKDGINYTGDGFFSLDDGTRKCNPILDNISLDPTYNRDETGMDKYIIGFAESMTKESIKKQLIVSSIQNFLYAFYNGKLVVKYGDTVVDKKHLDDLFELYNSEIDNLTKEYYETLKNPDRTIQCEVFEPEDVKIFIKMDPDYSRRAAIVRQTGMKIFDKDKLNGRIGFSSVVLLAKDKVNAYFKRLENPEHTAWSEYRKENKAEVKKYQDIFFNALKETIIELHGEDSGEPVDADGMNEYLPYTYVTGEKNKTEGLSNEVKEKKTKPKKKKKKPSSSFEEEEIYYEKDEFGNIIENTIEVRKGTDPKPGPPNPNPHPGTDINIDPDGEPTKLSISDKFTGKKKIPNENIRIKLNHNRDNYEFKVISKEDIKEGYIEIDISGEQETVKTNVLNALLDGVKTEVRGNKVYVGNLSANDTHNISFELSEKGLWSLEVNAYAD